MSVIELDHVVIHGDDWDAAHSFYVELLGFERVENPEGAANPLGAWAYRLGGVNLSPRRRTVVFTTVGDMNTMAE